MKYIYFFTLLAALSVNAMSGVGVGEKSPSFSLKTTEGKIFDLSQQAKTTIIVFFRGSWCPYCINQLKEINKEVMSKINKETIQLVAISVDRPVVAKKMKAKFNLDFTIISDTKAKSLKAFNIVNKISDELVAKYKASYKIDVEGDSGESHHMIAHPAVFIVKNGKIIFSDVQKDYKVRTNNSEILKAITKK
jgi:peroxiredoxin